MIKLSAEAQDAMYDAFFDELAELEKVAIMQKVSGVNPAWRFVRQIGRGYKSWLTKGKRSGRSGISRGAEHLTRVYRRGAEQGGALGGMGAILRTGRGKALATTLGGGALLAGGASHLSGRGGGQNVYVR